MEIQSLLSHITSNGISIIADPLKDIPFTNESDRKFYEVAKFCHAPLITGNTKHYPKEDCIVTVADFYNMYFSCIFLFGNPTPDNLNEKMT